MDQYHFPLCARLKTRSPPNSSNKPYLEPSQAYDEIKSKPEQSALLYKKYHDWAVRAPPGVRFGDQVHAQFPPNYMLATKEREKDERRSKLLSRASGSF